MDIELSWQTHKFRPSIYGNIENYSIYPDRNTLSLIKEKAYVKSPKPSWFVDRILKVTLASGMCSGLSAYSLMSFTGNIKANYDINLYVAVMQSRTWGRPFVLQCLRSYFSKRLDIFKELKKGFLNNDLEGLPLLVLVPRLNNIRQITYAHMVVPYQIKKGLTKVIVSVYDSNYPRNDDLTLEINLLAEQWSYLDKNSKQWVITINYLGNLIKQVPFL